MEWTQVFTIVGANIVMLLWMIRESNQDRREFNALIREIKEEVSELRRANDNVNVRLSIAEKGIQ